MIRKFLAMAGSGCKCYCPNCLLGNHICGSQACKPYQG